tara:strand:+ start:573 stop:752 length:180 start_codon:yes stop_codon:yes gene_type:complete
MDLEEIEDAMRQVEAVQDAVADWATDEILENIDALVENLEDLIARERARLQAEEEEEED